MAGEIWKRFQDQRQLWRAFLSVQSNTRFAENFVQENVLFLADPKSLHHVMQASPYGYKRVSGQRVISALVMDRGLLWADGTKMVYPLFPISDRLSSTGDVHKRQKRAILPAFSVPEIRAFLPIFLSDIEKIAAKWQDMIHTGPSGQSAIVNVHYWLSKAALDS